MPLPGRTDQQNHTRHAIRSKKPLKIPKAQSEFEYLKELKKIAAKNKVFKTYIGQGYYDTIIPSCDLKKCF